MSKIESNNGESGFSRYEINRRNQAPLPIFPLTYPDENKVGVVLVGDYVAQDLIQHMQHKGTRNNWIVVSTTQSDHVPTQCTDVDFNFFTNHSGTGEYLSSPASHVPFSTELGDGHYVDPEIFSPAQDDQKEWDILYPAKYFPTKKIELLLEAASLDPSIKIAVVGWPVVSERKAEESRLYRERILEMASELPNVTVFDNSVDEQHAHTNTDGSVVVGKYTKEEMRNLFYAKSRSVVFLSETTEAINRACTEALCCDVPILVAPTSGGLDKLVTQETGVVIERTPPGIIDGLQSIKASESLKPRETFTSSYGKGNANEKLRQTIQQVSHQKGLDVNWEEYREYGGDLWVEYSTYSQII